MIRKSPESGERLLREVEVEKIKVMEHNKNSKELWKDTTDNYQARCAVSHRSFYKDMTTDKRSWFKKLIERWI